jgi:hypothetical protein
MPTKWQATLHAALQSLRDFALTALIAGGVQVLVALVLWPIVFRKQPVGFSLSLSAVGFGCWLLAFIASFADRRRQRFNMSRAGTAAPQQPAGALDGTILGPMQDQLQRSGCGFVLLISSIIPLGIALLLRVQYDMRAGYTLREIFPPMP